MSATNNLVDDLERQRQELEDNTLKLQKSLYHWRLWEAEYDGIKEELDCLNDASSKEEMLQAARDFGGALVNEEEVKALVLGGSGSGSGKVSRTREQVVNMISKRIDYVQQNAATMEKRLRSEENKLRALDEEPVLKGAGLERNGSNTGVVAAGGGGGRAAATAFSEGGKDLPVTDIFEQLDEEGNLISGSTTTPGSQAPELLEVLRKAGVKDVPDLSEREQKRLTEKSDAQSRVTDVTDESDTITDDSAARGQPPKRAYTPEIETKNEESSRKTGSLKRDAVSESQKSSAKDTTTQGAQPATVSEATNEVPKERHQNQTSAFADQPTDDQQELPVTDVDESPEDADLRREMLQYGINEVGAVVAELELDDDASDVSIGDGDSLGDVSEDIEDEDEFGRSTNPALSEDYHQKMRELEKSLNARGLWNVGKDTHTLPDTVKGELEKPSETGAKSPVQDTVPERPASKKKPKKSVAFAEDLDIAPPSQPPASAPPKEKLPPKQPAVPAISDSVVERTERVGQKQSQNSTPKKASRFKSARNKLPDTAAESDTATPTNTTSNPRPSRPSQFRSSINAKEPPNPNSLPLYPAKPQEPKPFSQPISETPKQASRSTPQPPEGKTLADKLFEREVPEGAAEAPEPDELDEQLHRKEIASEFYRMRNRMVQQNGGFVDDKEPETVPIETTDEPPKRVSKFKAARMR